ncbi:ArsC family reductase [Colwellia sp. 1_MG-2023]|uniref:ArsC family reductase n=1 Tax=Colwellia sp. 1_MG-2023 TaxID=3062649 RepID=UPI0026E442BE|nr:ArsC family reductase [Colwellia sp. 1_MG-2023]MDO6446137.1 ArsC family reductase [Colwellia sp. 1_MG-2023]
MTTLYGIKNCDTIKKARKWLEDQQIPYQFHDFKTDGLSHELLAEFVSKSDWQILLNKRSTTYRNLSDEIKENLTDDVMFNAVLAQPTLLKRPLLSLADNMHIGFKKEQYQELFAQ